MQDEDIYGSEVDKDGADVDMDEVRSELEGAAEDLGRLTQQLVEWGLVVERLELLVSEVLKLVPAAAVVIDAEGRLVAAAQGAFDHPTITEEVLGRQASSVLPQSLAAGIAAVARTTQDSAEAPAHRDRASGHGREDAGPGWVTISGAEVVALPGGWALAVLDLG